MPISVSFRLVVLALLILLPAVAAAQLDTLDTHYSDSPSHPCRFEWTSFDPDASAEHRGYVNGTGGPFPFNDGGTTVYRYFSEQGVSLPVPQVSGKTTRLGSEIYVWWADYSRPIGTPDDFKFIVYKVLADGVFQELTRFDFNIPDGQNQPFELYDPKHRIAVPLASQVDLPEQVLFSIETRPQGHDNDTIVFLFTFGPDNNPSQCNPNGEWGKWFMKIVQTDYTDPRWQTIQQTYGTNIPANVGLPMIVPTIEYYQPSIYASISDQSTPDIVCPGESTNFTVNLTVGTGPWSYKYKLNNGVEETVNVPTGTSHTLAVVPDQAGLNLVTLTQVSNGTFTQPLNLIGASVQATPPAAASIAYTGVRKVCEGDSVRLTTPAVASIVDLTYVWQRDGLAVPGAADTTIFYAKTAGTYTLLVTNRCGQTQSSNNVVVEVNPYPTAEISNIGNNVLSATQGDSYTWNLFDGTNHIPVGGQTQQQYSPGATGIYSVTVTANGCSTTSAPYTFVPSSVATAASSGFLTLYPNPAENTLWLENKRSAKTPVQLQIVDMQGRSVLSQNCTAPTSAIDVQTLAAGTYTVLISAPTGQWQSRLMKK